MTTATRPHRPARERNRRGGRDGGGRLDSGLVPISNTIRALGGVEQDGAFPGLLERTCHAKSPARQCFRPILIENEKAYVEETVLVQ